MELVGGQTIADAAAAEKLDLSSRLAWFSKACRAVAYAHDMKITHQEIKSSNLRITPGGELKVFGIGLADLDDVCGPIGWSSGVAAWNRPGHLRTGNAFG
jgi:serine/threonine protein kinase